MSSIPPPDKPAEPSPGPFEDSAAPPAKADRAEPLAPEATPEALHAERAPPEPPEALATEEAPPSKVERARQSRTDDGPRASRPRYLLVALIAALVLGAGCWTEGWSRLDYFRSDRASHAELTDDIRDDGDRARAEALFERFVEASDHASGRAVPIAAATFVLGAALLTLAARGIAGRSNTRSALMQVVVVQALVVGASYFATRDMWDAEADLQYETALIRQRERLPPSPYAEATFRQMRRWAPPGWLAFRTLTSALIVIALSRPRSRAFFEAAAQPVPPR